MWKRLFGGNVMGEHQLCIANLVALVERGHADGVRRWCNASRVRRMKPFGVFNAGSYGSIRRVT